MKRMTGLMEKIASFENLLEAYRSAAKGKRYREEVLIFSSNLEENLLELRAELRDCTYRVGKYREFYVNYPKRRLVMALSFVDRVVQWAIYRQINPFIDKRFISHSYGCRTGFGTLAAVQQVFSWVQQVSRKPDADEYRIKKLDVSKYFYRIDHETALNIYDEYVDDEWFDWLMRTIICDENVPFGLPFGKRAEECTREERLFDVGLPIGNLTSQETANVYLDKLDKYCKHVLHIRKYARYMDDIVFIVKGEAEAERLHTAIADFLRKEMKLELNQKSRVFRADQTFEFVGAMINPHGIRLRKKTIRHAKRSLRHAEEMYALGVIDLKAALDTIRSYIGLAQHKSAYNLRRWIAENIVLRRDETARKRAEESICRKVEGTACA